MQLATTNRKKKKNTLRAMDHDGNLIHRGNAPLVVEIRVTGEEPVPAVVQDIGDGTYAVSYTVTKSSPLDVALIVSHISSPAVRILRVECRGGAMVQAKCRVDAGRCCCDGLRRSRVWCG